MFCFLLNKLKFVIVRLTAYQLIFNIINKLLHKLHSFSIVPANAVFQTVKLTIILRFLWYLEMLVCKLIINGMVIISIFVDRLFNASLLVELSGLCLATIPTEGIR